MAAVSYNNGYEPGRSVAVTFSSSDAGSGVATRQLQRSSAPLTSSTGVCGSTYTSFARVGPTNPTSVYIDSQVTNATCYKYRYVVTDQLGNQTIAVSASVDKVDYQGATTATAGLLSQWRLGESYTATDTFTGTAGTLLSSRTGEIGATWTKWVNVTHDLERRAERRRPVAPQCRRWRDLLRLRCPGASPTIRCPPTWCSRPRSPATTPAWSVAPCCPTRLDKGTRYSAVYSTDSGGLAAAQEHRRHRHESSGSTTRPSPPTSPMP